MHISTNLMVEYILSQYKHYLDWRLLSVDNIIRDNILTAQLDKHGLINDTQHGFMKENR